MNYYLFEFNDRSEKVILLPYPRTDIIDHTRVYSKVIHDFIFARPKNYFFYPPIKNIRLLKIEEYIKYRLLGYIE